MRAISLSLIALAVSAGYVQSIEAQAFVDDQAEAEGFIEDANLDVGFSVHPYGSGFEPIWRQYHGNAHDARVMPSDPSMTLNLTSTTRAKAKAVL